MADTSLRPTPGRIVLVNMIRNGEPNVVNGTSEFPAIVTNVHSDTMIDARVLINSAANPPWETSIPLAETVEEGYNGSTWRWPPRV